MTKEEALNLSQLAKKIQPKSSDEQVALLQRAILNYPFAEAKEAIVEIAMHSEFVNVPKTLEKLNFREPISPENRLEMERAAADALAEERRKAIADADASVTAAREFCEQNEGHLDDWRAAIITKMPHLGPLTEKRKTLESTALVCAIYTEFGKVPAGSGL